MQDFVIQDFVIQDFAIQDLEVAMRKEIFQDNKARWEVFEWMGSTQSRVIWAAVAVIVALGILYLVS